jgi:hypothetical protein
MLSTTGSIAAIRRQHPLAIVAILAIGSSIARAFLAHRFYGFQTGDDVEVAEEAFRRAVGLVHSPWNVRSLLIPDLVVAPVVWLSHAIGLRDHRVLAEIARYPFILLSGLNIVLVFVLGRRWYGESAAIIASALYAVHWIPLVYGSSLFPRTIAVTCILSSAILLTGGGGVKRALLAGLLAALAVTARYSEAIYFISLLLLQRGEDRSEQRRTLPALIAGFLAGLVVAVGIYDRVTWGYWFGSLVEFAELTFVRGDASSSVVVQAPWWYFSNLAHWFPLSLMPAFVIAVRGAELRRAVAFIAVPVVVLSAIFHKELRYLQVVVPFVLLIAARGSVILWNDANRRRVTALLLAMAVPLGMTHIGQVAKRSTNAVTAALWIASRRPPAIALSQAWAYGGRLFLGNDAAITELGAAPDLRKIRRASPPFSAVAVYSDDADGALTAVCTESGLSHTTAFRDRGGHDVILFSRP